RSARARVVIAARGGHRPEGRDHGLAGFPRALDGGEDFLCRSDHTARAVDAEDDRLDRRILRVLAELANGGGAVHDDALYLHHADLRAARGATILAGHGHENPDRAEEQHEDAHPHSHSDQSDAAAGCHLSPPTTDLLLILVVVLAATPLPSLAAAAGIGLRRLPQDCRPQVLEA